MDTFSKLHGIRQATRVYLPKHFKPSYAEVVADAVLIGFAVYIFVVLMLL
jgi:hypothetical protein